MPSPFSSPAPRSYIVANVVGNRAELTREWLRYLADDIPRMFGGSGNVYSVPEVKAIAESAQASANEALLVGLMARAAADSIPRFDVRPGSGVSVQRDAQGFVVSASGGSGSPDDAGFILAGQVFGG